MSPVTSDPSSDSFSAPRADGRSTRWNDHRAERRRELARAARKAVHRLGPEVSMDEIASHLGTSKSIVYRYFSDKAGLQQAIGELVLEAIHDALASAASTADAPELRLRAMVQAYLELVEHSPQVYAFVTGGFPGGTEISRPGFGAMASRLVAEPLADLLREADVAPDDADLWAAGVIGFVHGASEWWLVHGAGATSGAAGPVSSADLAARLAEWLWVGAVGRRTGLADPPQADDPPTASEEAS